jgi:N-acetylglucosaminyl-diphospho-decaprenol L-rhamnosyltransferase
MAIGIIIVNYRTADLTIECLRSLAKERQAESIQVIVVDNDSQDGSVEKIATAVISEDWSDWVLLVASEHNGGFAFGNNIAIRHFMNQKNAPEFIYLLNPDTYVRHNAVTKLVAFMEKNPKVGIVGSRIENPDGGPQLSSFKFHTLLTELNRGFNLGILTKILSPWINSQKISAQAERTDWVSGASMMIRRSIFEQVGLLDEAYFMYFEETDFCLQAARAGWECWYVPESKVVHYVGQSSGLTNTARIKRMPTYWFDSRHRYFQKNYGITYSILADLFWLVGFSTWRLRNVIQRKQHNFPPHLLWDSFINSVFFRRFKLQLTRNK